MLKKFLSQFHIKFPRSVVYMLQSVEYDLKEYLKWLRRAEHFGHVEKRKSLVLNRKTRAILFFTWALILGLIVAWLVASYYLGLWFLILVPITPILSAVFLVVPIWLSKVLIQKPVERRKVRRATKLLKTHNGIRIAIAGSYGKTSMRNLLYTILSEGKKVATQEHNYNTFVGISDFIKKLKGDEEVLIFELGEYHPGDIRKMCKIINPDIGIITGVNEAHLVNFKSVTETRKEIFSLADFLVGKKIYLNGENKIVAQNKILGGIYYDRNRIADWKISNSQTDLTGTRFTMQKHDSTINVESKLLGLHQVGPLALGVEIADFLGLTVEQIESGAKKTSAFEHRLEPRVSPAGVITLDDSYNGNPDGVFAVIDFLTSLKDAKRYYMTPGLVELGTSSEAVHRKIGQKLAQSGIENVILIKNSVTPDIEFGLRENNYTGKVTKFDDALTAFQSIQHITTVGDVVLLQNDWPDQYA